MLHLRYPYSSPPKKHEDPQDLDRNPYAMKILPEDLGTLNSSSASAAAAASGGKSGPPEKPEIELQPDRLNEGNLIQIPSKVLSNIFSVSTKLCGAKFEMKVDDVRFVGHPISLDMTVRRRERNIIPFCFSIWIPLKQWQM